MNNYTKWTENELSFLTKNYGNLGGNECARILTRSSSSVHNKAGILGLKVNKERLSLNSSNNQILPNFNEIKSPEAAYVLGFLWADGTIRSYNSFRISLSIHQNDLEDIKPIFLKTALWKIHLPKTLNTSASVYINNRPLWEDLKQLGYWTKTGGTPEKVLKKIPKDLKHYWWRGFFDGDGYISKPNPKRSLLALYSCYEQDWDFIKLLPDNLYSEFKIQRRNDGNARNSSVYICNRNGILRFGKYIYRGENFGLTRKFARYIELENQLLFKNIRPIDHYLK